MSNRNISKFLNIDNTKLLLIFWLKILKDFNVLNALTNISKMIIIVINLKDF